MRYQYSILLFLLMGIGLLFEGCGSDHSSPTSPQQQSARLVYVALGASDAVGIGAFPLENGYVYRIRDELEERADEVILYNLGVSGVRISYIERTELPTALAHQPDLVTIWTGPNDIIQGSDVADFEASLSTILNQLRNETSAFVVVANIPDLTALPLFLIFPDTDVTEARVNAFNAAISRQAALYGVPIADLSSGNYVNDWEYISVDGFHPSNKGHAKIAERFLNIILPHF